jgi:hypothetical protein
MTFFLEFTHDFESPRILALVKYTAGGTSRLSGRTNVAPVQDEPMMSVTYKFVWNDLQQLLFYL